MNGIKRLIVILFLISEIAALTHSQAPVKLNGSEGMALLNSLTKSPVDTNNTSLNNTSSSNTSLSNTSLDATNVSTKLTLAKPSSGDIWAWGSRPKDPPLRQGQSGDDYLNGSA